MQAQSNRFGVELPEQIGLVLRVARKQWGCCEGGEPATCDGTIFAREHYVEYVGEVAAYQSGSRYCLPCAERTWGVRVASRDGDSTLEWV